MKSQFINPPMLNVDSVVRAGLCMQCGACEAACPHDIIEIKRDSHWRFHPDIAEDEHCQKQCNGFCVDICPGVNEDPGLWPTPHYDTSDFDQWCSGPLHTVKVGYATDSDLRKQGTSGGAVTAFLLHLLESGKVDGVLLVGPNRTSPYEHDIHIARTREEIIAAWGSKYYPMPIASKFREMARSGEKYAVVLLGCHMRALRLMEQRSKRLRDSIVVRLGLICGYCSGFKAVLDEASDQGFEDFSEVTRVDYRHGKWPGYVRIKSPDRESSTLIYKFLERLPFTTNYRCMICSDLMNETADLTFGDAWLKELTSKKDEGWSIIAVRNAFAAELLGEAVLAKKLVLEGCSKDALVLSQEKPMRYKKFALQARYAFTRKVLHRPLPNHDISFPIECANLNTWNKIGNWCFLLTTVLFFPNNRFRRFVMKCLPTKIVRWYIRTIFLMIAHDGSESFLRRLFADDVTSLNCDA